MRVHLRFTLTFQDFLNSQWLHVSRIWWRKVLRIGRIFIYPVLGIVLIVLTLAMESGRNSTGGDIIVAMEGALLVLYPFYFRYRLKKLYRGTRVNDGNVTLEISDKGIHTGTSNSRGEIAWTVVKSYAENKHLFMVYTAPMKFIAIPKRVCTAQQIDELRSLFQRHIQPKVN